MAQRSAAHAGTERAGTADGVGTVQANVTGAGGA